MNPQIIRQAARLTQVYRPRTSTSPILRRTYAQDLYKDKGPTPTGPSAGRSNRIPLIAAISLAAAIPVFYFLQSTIGTGNKSPASGVAEIKESRRAGGASQEYRDPRDSGKKTTSVDG